MAQYNRKDHLFQRAKDEGFRSRASYKLDEIQKRAKILRRGDAVLDLGAWPGGWLQVSSDIVGDSGVVVGIDLQKIEDLGVPNIRTIVGDITDRDVIARAKEIAGRDFRAVLSDLSPKLTGIREADEAAVEHLAECAAAAADQVLMAGGTLVIKLFKSQSASNLTKRLKRNFTQSRAYELDSTRSTSQEFYFVGQGFKRISADASAPSDAQLA